VLLWFSQWKTPSVEENHKSTPFYIFNNKKFFEVYGSKFIKKFVVEKQDLNFINYKPKIFNFKQICYKRIINVVNQDALVNLFSKLNAVKYRGNYSLNNEREIPDLESLNIFLNYFQKTYLSKNFFKKKLGGIKGKNIINFFFYFIYINLGKIIFN